MQQILLLYYYYCSIHLQLIRINFGKYCNDKTTSIVENVEIFSGYLRYVLHSKRRFCIKNEESVLTPIGRVTRASIWGKNRKLTENDWRFQAIVKRSIIICIIHDRFPPFSPQIRPFLLHDHCDSFSSLSAS